MDKVVHRSEKVSLIKSQSVPSSHCPLNVDRFQCISVYQLGVIYMYNVVVLSLMWCLGWRFTAADRGEQWLSGGVSN